VVFFEIVVLFGADHLFFLRSFITVTAKVKYSMKQYPVEFLGQQVL
jgi:hypothetical protein